MGENGQYLKVCYPKYKLGEEVVRDVKTPPTYGILILFYLRMAPYMQLGRQ